MVAIASAVGGVACVVLVVLIYILRQQKRTQGLYGERRDDALGEGDSSGPAYAAYSVDPMRPLAQAQSYQPIPFVLDDLVGRNNARGFTPPHKVYGLSGNSPSPRQTLQSDGTNNGQVPHMINHAPRNDSEPSFSASQGYVQQLGSTVDMPPAYVVDLQRGRVAI